MKKSFKGKMIFIVVLFFVLILIINITSCTKSFIEFIKLTEPQYERNTSVFINELDGGKVTPCAVEVSRKTKSMWVINDKEYAVSKTRFNAGYDPTVNWRVDLSVLQYCGTYKDIDFYSSTGKCDNHILVSVENDTLNLLTYRDVLSPYKYDYTDFEIKGVAADSLEEIWSEHLSGEHNIRYLLIESDDLLETIELKLKSQPELVYLFAYSEYDGAYYSPLPYDEESNNYYSMGERFKDWSRVRKLGQW